MTTPTRATATTSTSTTRAGLTIRAIQTTETGTSSVTATRDHDPRDAFVEGLELPRGLERELVQDDRENLYELNREDSRMLATIGAFRVVAERDLEAVRRSEWSPAEPTRPSKCEGLAVRQGFEQAPYQPA